MDDSLLQAATVIGRLGVGRDLRNRIADIEASLYKRTSADALALLADDGVDDTMLRSALMVKAMAGQINVVVHAIGILVSLPYLLDEDEVIESLSLGAGNTGRSHDLETDRRVAEFKFIGWRGGPEAIRQNTLFVDLFNLASSDTTKRRELYVVGKAEPLRFLNNRRAIRSVLSKHSSVQERFDKRHAQDGFITVNQYWAAVRDRVDILDLKERVPAFSSDAISLLEMEAETV